MIMVLIQTILKVSNLAIDNSRLSNIKTVMVQKSLIQLFQLITKDFIRFNQKLIF